MFVKVCVWINNDRGGRSVCVCVHNERAEGVSMCVSAVG